MSSEPIPISAEGLAQLEAELHDLTENQRPVIVKRVATAREEGDLRENFAYHDARHELGLLDGRRKTIEATLRRAVVVDTPAATGTIAMGSTVVVADEHGEMTYSVVGPVEADIAKGRVSINSPLGAALVGSGPGDEVEFETPGGKRAVRIISVS